MRRARGGFTLIELLVVVAIVGLFSTILTPSVAQMYAKSRDVVRKADFQAVSIALNGFLADTGRMPANYRPCCGVAEGSSWYTSSMNELVNARFLKEIPTSPPGSLYSYYNYGAGNNIGAIMVTDLETYSGTTGPKGSCRPWAPNQNWCSQAASSEYCVCNPY